MSLAEYIETTGISLTDFSKLIPCSYSYPGMIIKGKATPSYRMAARIEQITGGLVPRTNWYPAGEPVEDVEAEL